MPKNKAKKQTKVRDLKPSKDAKGGKVVHLLGAGGTKHNLGAGLDPKHFN